MNVFYVLLVVVLLLVGLIIAYLFMGNIVQPFKEQATKAGQDIPPLTARSSSFDYSKYILTKKSVNLLTYNNCEKLMSAIKNSAVTGVPFKVDEIDYGLDLVSQAPFPIIGGNCPSKLIQLEISKGLNQTICNFNTITSNPPVGKTDYGGISDVAFPFAQCFYNYDPYSTLPRETTSIFGGSQITNVIGPNPEDVNSNPGIANIYYSPDQLYLRNGDYYHKNSFNNATAFTSAYIGPGKYGIYVGNAKSINGECKFNVYLCTIPAIAKSIDNRTIDIFNIMKGLELGIDSDILPYYVVDLSGSASELDDYTKTLYYWNYYDVPLDGSYRVETILNAIKEGMYLNVLGRNTSNVRYSFAHPHWDVAEDSSLAINDECWKTGFDSMLNSGSFGDKTRSIRFNCGTDKTCSGTLRIKNAMRIDTKTFKIDGKDINFNYVSGFTAFCDS
ncbi:MAG: hypothetical protein V1678_03125 [Candidatus Aenigmatarchaeota archaeon]